MSCCNSRIRLSSLCSPLIKGFVISRGTPVNIKFALQCSKASRQSSLAKANLTSLYTFPVPNVRGARSSIANLCLAYSAAIRLPAVVACPVPTLRMLLRASFFFVYIDDKTGLLGMILFWRCRTTSIVRYVNIEICFHDVGLPTAWVH